VRSGRTTLFDSEVVDACLSLFLNENYRFPESLLRPGGAAS
jgi:hypothetical protein